LSGSSIEPEASATIRIGYMDVGTAHHVLEAISPDNYDAPRGVKIEAEFEGTSLRLSVSCARGVGSLLETVDDILSCVQAAERALTEVLE
jgi:hypothetical protein